jgi:hypothetical protein
VSEICNNGREMNAVANEPPAGSGIDPDVNVEIPAPILVDTIFQPGMSVPLLVLAIIVKNAEAHISLFVPSAKVNVCTMTIAFRRPPAGTTPGEWFLAACRAAGEELFEKFKAESKKPKLVKPDGALLVPADKKLAVNS